MSVAATIRKKTARLFASAAGRLGHDLSDGFVRTLPTASQQTIAKVTPFTMTSAQRLGALCDAITYIEDRRIAGDIVECGVWRGGSSMAIALTLLGRGSTDRALYLYDTYEGMSEPTDYDREIATDASAADMLATSSKDSGVWAYAGLDEVKRNLASTGYPADKLNFVRGKVEDTIPGIIPGSIALLRLDTDWYESTRHELQYLFPLLSDGGVLIIDDYGHWDGARRAVDEYFAQTGRPLLLYRVDYSGRMAIKA